MSNYALQCGAGKADITPPIGALLITCDIARGGYECWHFLLAMRTTYPLPKNTDDYWVQKNLEILRRG